MDPLRRSACLRNELSVIAGRGRRHGYFEDRERPSAAMPFHQGSGVAPMGAHGSEGRRWRGSVASTGVCRTDARKVTWIVTVHHVGAAQVEVPEAVQALLRP